MRTIIKNYIFIVKNIHDKACEELEPKLREAKSMLELKVEKYCQDNSPESAFEVYFQKEEDSESERCCDVQLRLINKWEETIKKYSHLNLRTNQI